MSSKQLRVAGYVRNSTEGQAKDETHEVQLDWLRQQERQHGWALTLFLEPGASGETISGRPEFRKLLNDVKAGKFDLVAVKAIDRLCRSQALDDWAEIVATFTGAGVKVLAGGQTLDLNQPNDSLIFTMMGPAIAGFEKKLILQRTRDGKERALRENRKPSGRDPYGYSYNHAVKQMEMADSEAAIVRRLYALVLEGRTLTAIQRQLQQEGVLNRYGRLFARSAIYDIVTAPTYKGRWQWKGGSVSVPPLISPDEWDRVQRKLKENARKQRGRRPTNAAPFRGLVWCGTCSLPVYTSSVRNGVPGYLTCSSNIREDLPGVVRCSSTWRYGATAELAWALARQVIEAPESVAAIQGHLGRAADRLGSLEAEIKEEQRKLNELAFKVKAQSVRYANGVLSEEAYDHAVATLAQARRAVEARLADLVATFEAQTAAASPPVASLTFIETLRSRLDTATALERDAALRLLCPSSKDGLWLMPDGTMELRGIVSLPASPSTKLSAAS